MSVFEHQLKPHDPASGRFIHDAHDLQLDARLDAHPQSGSSKPIHRVSKLTIAGLIYVGVTVFLAIGAINSQNNLLFWLFGVSIATLIVSGVFSGNVLIQIRMQPHAIPDAFAGEGVRLHYLVTNRSKMLPLYGAMISEIPAQGHPPARFTPAGVLHLGPRQHLRALGSFVPTNRGRYTLSGVRLSTRFPFGLFEKSLVFACPRSLMVLPYKLAIKPELVRVLQGHGEEVRKRTESSGSSTEYWGLREYTPGDPKRSIAWKQSARHRSLVVIEHAQPIATRLWIWISPPKSINAEDPGAIERAIALAASLITHATMRGVPVGLWAPTMGIRNTPATGKTHMMRCVRSLGMIDLASEFGRDTPPSSSKTDDVLMIRSGPSSPSVSGNIRMLDADDPAQWLIDPSSLPASLAIARGDRG